MLVAPTLTTRAANGAPLTAAQGDANLAAIQSFLIALEAQVSAAVQDNGVINLYFTDVGTTNAYQINPAEWVVSPNIATYQPAYFNGLTYFIKAANTNTGASTLAVASSASNYLPAIPMLLAGAPLVAGAISQGQLFAAVYDLASNTFNVLAGGQSTSSSSSTSTGSSSVITPNLNTYQPADVALPGTNTAATFPHGFSTTPNGYTASLVCVNADSGFSVGQQAPLSVFFNANNQPAFEVQVNLTNIVITEGAVTPKVIAPTGGSQGTAVTITPANWHLRVSAFIFTAPNRYQSAATALLTANTQQTFPHGLTVPPQFYVGLVNSVAEQGYNTGDFVPISNFFDANADPAFTVSADSVNVYVEQNNVGTPANATQTCTFSNQPANNSTITIGASTYTFQTVLSPTNGNGNVLIGAALSNTIANLSYAINGSGGTPGTNYGSGTVVNASATAVAGSTTLVATAILAGTAGNSIAVGDSTSPASNASWGATTLLGGVNGPQVICASGTNIGTAQSIHPANWTISVFAFAPAIQSNITLPALDFAVANPDGGFLYNNDLIVFNRGRVSSQTYISNINLVNNAVSQLQVFPNSNLSVAPQYNNIAPFRFNDGLDRMVWTSNTGIYSLVLGSNAASATPATGTLTFTGTPANGDTVSVDVASGGNQVYTFQTTLTNVAGHVLIGGSQANAIANLVAAMTLTGTAGTQYAALTTLDSNFTASSAGSSILVTATQAGTAGNLITTAVSSSACSWGGLSYLQGGTGNALVRYNTTDNHNLKPVWVDQSSSTSSPDFYLVGSGLDGAAFMSNALPMYKVHYTGGAYAGAATYGNALNLHSPLIINSAAFQAFHNNNKSGTSVAIPVLLFQYNPVTRRIYMADADTGYLFIFNLSQAASNNISSWWALSDSVRYPQLTFVKAVAISGSGNLWASNARDHAAICYDLTTGVESGIVHTRVGNPLTFGSVTFTGWQQNA